MSLWCAIHIRSIVVACCLFSGLLTACTPTMPKLSKNVQTIKDGGFLSGEPCGPPCFMGIVPGVTKEGEVIHALQANGLYQECATYDKEAESGSRGIVCTNLSIQLRHGTDIAEGISFRPSDKIILQDVIAKYGEPNAVLVTAAGIPEAPKTAVVIYYNSLTFQLDLCDQEGITFRAEPTTEICDIGYFDAASYLSFSKSMGDLLSDWQGYGEYQQYASHK